MPQENAIQPPPPSRCSLDTFSHIGEGFYCRAVLSHLTGLAHYRNPPRLIARTQPCPAARPKGKNEKLPGGACSYPGNLSFSLPRGAGGQGHFQFYSSCFHVTNRFFVSFLVRPALLPYGKRGFRAAICNIARPQPPAAALWLQERIVPSCVPFLPPFPSSFTPC